MNRIKLNVQSLKTRGQVVWIRWETTHILFDPELFYKLQQKCAVPSCRAWRICGLPLSAVSRGLFKNWFCTLHYDSMVTHTYACLSEDRWWQLKLRAVVLVFVRTNYCTIIWHSVSDESNELERCLPQNSSSYITQLSRRENLRSGTQAKQKKNNLFISY